MRNDDTTAARAAAQRLRGGAALLALALAACGDRAPSAPPAPEPAAIDPAKTMNPADLKDVTASYRCEQGHRIDIVRDKVARVALADGRVIKIERIDGSVPPTFMDNGLALSLVGDGTAKLDDENGNTVSCEKAETARPKRT